MPRQIRVWYYFSAIVNGERVPEYDGLPATNSHSLTVDEAWTPYLQTSLELPLDLGLFDLIDPTEQTEDVRVEWSMTAEYPDTGESSARLFESIVRGVQLDHTNGIMRVSLMGRERQTDTYVHTDPEPRLFPAGMLLDDLVNDVLATANAGYLDEFWGSSFRLPEPVQWVAGQSATNFLRPIVALSGMKLLDPGVRGRGWYLITPGLDVIGSGSILPVTIPPEEMSELTETASLERNYSDQAVIVYTWTDDVGRSRTAVDSSPPSGALRPTFHVQTQNINYPGAGAAQYLADRLSKWRHEHTFTTLINLDVRPGLTVNITPPGRDTVADVVRSVTYNADGTMQVTSSGNPRIPLTFDQVGPVTFAELDPTVTFADVRRTGTLTP